MLLAFSLDPISLSLRNWMKLLGSS